jgi:acetyl-CoA carboxylase biotin carboxyl carrier protein
MAEQPSEPAQSFDVQRIHDLVRLMKRYDLTALDVKDGSVQVRLRRRPPGTEPRQASTEQPALEQVATSPATTAPAPRKESSPTAVATAPKTVVIESPMVGTYYSSSAPDSPTFVSVGSVVHPDSIVCIIEAMKVFTDIPAGVTGTIAAILVNTGQAVEFGQPLFRVIPS